MAIWLPLRPFNRKTQMQGMCGLVQRNLYICEIWGSLGGDY
jgi:hypothetical protein